MSPGFETSAPGTSLVVLTVTVLEETGAVGGVERLDSRFGATTEVVDVVEVVVDVEVVVVVVVVVEGGGMGGSLLTTKSASPTANDMSSATQVACIE